MLTERRHLDHNLSIRPLALRASKRPGKDSRHPTLRRPVPLVGPGESSALGHAGPRSTRSAHCRLSRTWAPGSLAAECLRSVHVVRCRKASNLPAKENAWEGGSKRPSASLCKIHKDGEPQGLGRRAASFHMTLRQDLSPSDRPSTAKQSLSLVDYNGGGVAQRSTVGVCLDVQRNSNISPTLLSVGELVWAREPHQAQQLCGCGDDDLTHRCNFHLISVHWCVPAWSNFFRDT